MLSQGHAVAVAVGCRGWGMQEGGSDCGCWGGEEDACCLLELEGFGSFGCISIGMIDGELGHGVIMAEWSSMMLGLEMLQGDEAGQWLNLTTV